MATDTILISHVSGKVWMRTADGQLIELHQGMRVPVNAHILTDESASVTLQGAGVPPVVVGQNTDMLVTEDLAQAQPQAAENAVAAPPDAVATQVLAALDAGEDPFAILDPTAAVLAGGEGGGGGFSRIASVVETVSPLALAYPLMGVETPEFMLMGGVAGSAADAPLDGPADDASQPTLPPTLDVTDDPDGDAGGLDVAPGVFDIPENMTQDGDGKNGSFTFTADGGLAHLTFTFDPAAGKSGEVSVTQAMLDQLAADSVPIIIDTDKGLLHLTGYDAASGTVGYTYWSDGQQHHDQAAGKGESLPDTITITVTDDQGRHQSAALVANITDTLPDAQNDENSVTEGDALAAMGNVILGTTGAGDDVVEHPGAKDSAYDDAGGYPKLVGVTLSGIPDGAPAWLGDTHAVDNGDGSTTFTIHGLYGDLVIQSDGSYAYTLAGPGDALGRYDDVQALGGGDTPKEVFQYTIEDADGDQALADLTITVQGVDTPPTIAPGDPNAGGVHVVVSEEGLKHANPDSGNGDYAQSAPSGDTTDRKHAHGTLTVGDHDTPVADLEVSFGDTSAAADLGITAAQGAGGAAVSLTSNGQPIYWKSNGAGGLIGYTGDPDDAGSHHTVIEVRLNPGDTGPNRSYSVTLHDTLDHPVNQRGSDLGTEDAIDIKIPVFVSDGNSAEGSHIVIRVEDDSPHVYQSADSATLDPTTQQNFEGSLGVSVGADRAGSHVKIVSGDFDPENPQASDLDGQPVTVLLDGAGEPVALTSGGEPLVYQNNPDGSVTAVTKEGGVPIFTVSGDALNGTYKVTWSGQGQVDPVGGGEESSTYSAAATFVTGDKNVVTGAYFGDAPVEINLSGVTGNPGDNEDLVYLKNGLLGVGNNHSIDGDPGHGGANGERLVIDFSPKDGSGAAVTMVRIDITNLKLGETALIQVAGVAGVFTIEGMTNNGHDTIPVYIVTSADQAPVGSKYFLVSDLDAITQVQLGAGANDDYSVKSIGIEYETSVNMPNPDLNLGLGAWVTDGDGDGAYADLPITFRSGADQAEVTVTGGNDVVHGGDGSHTLWGGYGDDTFVWKLGDQDTTGGVAVDTIKNFGTGQSHLGTDALDLSDLLSGHADGSNPGDHGNLDQYLSIRGDGHKTYIDVKVNADGTAADHVTQQIIIDNVDLTIGHGGDQAALINSLITDGKLKVDSH